MKSEVANIKGVFLKRVLINALLLIFLVFSMGGILSLHLDGSGAVDHMHSGDTFSLDMARQVSSLENAAPEKIKEKPDNVPAIVWEDLLLYSVIEASSTADRAPPV